MLYAALMTLRPSVVAALLVAAISLPQTARAAEPTDADRAMARTLTLEGYEALDRKDYATAADRFMRASHVYPVPTVELGLAHAELGLGKLVSALATYSRIVRDGVPAGSPPAFAKAVDDARHEIQVLAPRIPSVIIAVNGPRNPHVTIDGVDIPDVALGVRRPVDPGAHVVRAAAPDFLPAEKKLTLLEGQIETVTLELAPAPVVPVDPIATPLVAPLPPPLPPPPPPPPSVPPSGSSNPRVAGFVGIGLGGAGLVVGAVTGGLAVAKHASLVDSCPGGHCYPSQEAALQPDVSTYHALGAASTVGLIAGAALLGTGTVLVVTSRRGTVAPVVGLGFAGARGSFQ
jgi:hypothetical protein